jgi:glycine cleavage system H lipoate-binding protein
MRCPFLREAQVKFCRASSIRKMIVRTPEHAADERCMSSRWISCPIAKQHCEEHPSQSHCPFLHEALVQHCSAAPVSQFIPYTEPQLSCCGTESHKYCEVYVSLAHPEWKFVPSSRSEKQHSGSEDDIQIIDGIPMPEWLAYAPNHMWLDLSSDGTCHVGVDAFFANVIGKVERVTFLSTKSAVRPTAVLTVRGVDLPLMFPNTMIVTGTNAYLRSHPEKIAAEPYSLGWLFEGFSLKSEHGENNHKIDRGLLRGREAREWMTQEVRRLTTYVHDHLVGVETMADGGTFTHGLMQHLSHDHIFHVYNEFFSPFAGWRTIQ